MQNQPPKNSNSLIINRNNVGTLFALTKSERNSPKFRLLPSPNPRGWDFFWPSPINYKQAIMNLYR